MLTRCYRPFDGPNVSCYLSQVGVCITASVFGIESARWSRCQFTNAIYVLGADSGNKAAVYIYNAEAKSWSTQAVDAGKFDPTDFGAILDHDTNVFCGLPLFSPLCLRIHWIYGYTDAYSKGELFSLDMELLKAGSGSTKQWNDVQAVPWDTSSYQPTMALAQNHVHFLGVPGVPDGSAKIFVIHCMLPIFKLVT